MTYFKEPQSERYASIIRIVETQGGILYEFDDRLWEIMADYVTVARNNIITAAFAGGIEIKDLIPHKQKKHR